MLHKGPLLLSGRTLGPTRGVSALDDTGGVTDRQRKGAVMQRKFFDVFASAIGAVMVVALVVAGSLLMWGYSFANSNVHNQLRPEVTSS